MNESKTYLVAVSTRKIVYFYDLNELFSDTNKKNTVYLELLQETYHSDNVTSIDTCIRKTLVATCSTDRTLTLWNYDKSSIEMCQYFDEDLLSVAMHPSGMYLLLATTNSLKYMSILTNKVQVLVVYNVRSCSNCLFTHGGHEFVIVHGTVVQVYSTVTHKEIRSVKTQDMGKIKQLKVSKDDHYLMCCSMAGIARVWDMTSLALVTEIVTKGLSYIGLSLHPNQEWLFLISTEKAVRQVQLPKADDCKKVRKKFC